MVETRDIGAKFDEIRECAHALDALNVSCSCPEYKQIKGQTAKGERLPAKREVQRIFIGPLQREVSFIRCEHCQKLSAMGV
jgi:hypothetical protein